MTNLVFPGREPRRGVVAQLRLEVGIHPRDDVRSRTGDEERPGHPRELLLHDPPGDAALLVARDVGEGEEGASGRLVASERLISGPDRGAHEGDRLARLRALAHAPRPLEAIPRERHGPDAGRRGAGLVAHLGVLGRTLEEEALLPTGDEGDVPPPPPVEVGPRPHAVRFDPQHRHGGETCKGAGEELVDGLGERRDGLRLRTDGWHPACESGRGQEGGTQECEEPADRITIPGPPASRRSGRAPRRPRRASRPGRSGPVACGRG